MNNKTHTEAFVSDFDSTFTEEDFYTLVIQNYYPSGEFLHRLFEQKEITVLELLTELFKKINQPEEKVKSDIRAMKLSPGALEFIRDYSNRRGDFYILSAGCDYYIRELLQAHRLDEQVQIFANHGSYKENRYIEMQPDPSSSFYSPSSGIDKGKVITHLKKKYESVIFAGDSLPDFSAAQVADKVFAKKGAALEEMLVRYGITYQSFENFHDIARYLSHNN